MHVRVIYTVPHASEESEAGDKGSLAIAFRLQQAAPGLLLAPWDHLGNLIMRTAEVDYNRKETEWPNLVGALQSHTSARLIDVHTYGNTLPVRWNGHMRGPLAGNTPILVVMVLPGAIQKQLYLSHFSAFPYIKGSESNRNVGLALGRGILLEFNSNALQMKGWDDVRKAVLHYIGLPYRF